MFICVVLLYDVLWRRRGGGDEVSETEVRTTREAQKLAAAVSRMEAEYDVTARDIYTMGPPDLSELRDATGNLTLWVLPEDELRCKWQYNYFCKFWYAIRCHLLGGFQHVRLTTLDEVRSESGAKGNDVLLVAHRSKPHKPPPSLVPLFAWRRETQQNHVRIGVFHVANEVARSGWPWYTEVDFVLRNYLLPGGRFPPHVAYVPLHHQMPSQCVPESPLVHSATTCTCGGRQLPLASSRRHLYSFSGSLRRGRGAMLKVFAASKVLRGRGQVRVSKHFGGDGPAPKEGHVEDILDSAFVLAPCGNVMETHRIYEALALGAIPVVQRCDDSEKAGDDLDGFFPLNELVHDTHEGMVAFVEQYASSGGARDALQRRVLAWWTAYTSETSRNATRVATTFVERALRWAP